MSLSGVFLTLNEKHWSCKQRHWAVFENFCLGLTFSYGTRDRKRFDRAEEWGLGTRQPNLPNVVVKLCHHFVVYCLTRQTLCSLFVVHTRERKRLLPLHFFLLVFVTWESAINYVEARDFAMYTESDFADSMGAFVIQIKTTPGLNSWGRCGVFLGCTWRHQKSN